MAQAQSRRMRQITELIEPVLSESGFDLEGLERTRAGKHSVLRILVDRDGGVDLDAVAELTQTLSSLLDTADVMGESPYTLEVSSPGVDRPLTAPRHWRRNRGRLVKVHLTEGEPFEGRIEDHDETGVVLRISGEEEQRRVEFAEIRRATIVIEFRRE